ncbi:MAG: hypothetical protein KAW12_06175 [Candidatus Aminicenantes bacterium]|nr:hypothetical protein [Candidatus Aminicenantes bacterium]
MTTVEIKSRLHEGIENINDKDFLLSIKKLVDEKNTPPAPLELSNRQLEQLDNAKKQIEKGDYLTNTQADKIVDEW